MSFETIKIKVGLQSGQVCKNAKIELIGITNISVNCKDESCGEYEVQFENPDAERCFAFKVTCSNCKDCGEQLIIKCLCNTNADCTNPCDYCDQEAGGVCNPKPCPNGCDQGVCLDDCIQCVSTCPPGKICTSYMRPDGKECKKCSCPPGKKENSFGDCVFCVNNSDCSKCFDCSGTGDCLPKNCGTGTCDINTGSCEECVNPSHCGVNQCCVNKKCVCCSGFIKDVNGNCIPKPPCTIDEDCNNCETCKITGTTAICIPRQCPPGQVCDDGVCKIACDCNNPASCGQGKICKNKGAVCVCETCGQCQTGCTQGCLDKCSTGEGCQPNPCSGSCTNGTQCGPNCGCNPITGNCESCSLQSCGTNCGNLLGCACSNSNVCEKVNPCSGTCKNGFDCGPNCTCYLEACVPCSFFSCNNGDCSSKEKCKCAGSTCTGDPAAKCADTLEIIKNDDCTIEGKLITASGCACPVIKVRLNNTTPTVSGSSLVYSFTAELFKGNNVDSVNRLDQTGTPGIASNETATSGSVEVEATVNYLNGVYPTTTLNTSAPISGKGITELFSLSVPAFGVNHATGGQAPKYVQNIVFKATVSQAAFPNGCSYASAQLGTNYTIQNNNSKFEISGVISSSDTKLPLFTWYKSNTGLFPTKLKDKYVAQVSGVYSDILSYPEAQSCYDYKLEVDCGCPEAAVKHIVFCSPTSMTSKFDKCNTRLKLNIPPVCSANKDLPYSVFVDTGGGYQLEISGLILNSGFNNDASPIVKTVPIKSVKLVLACDSQSECGIENFAPSITEYAANPAASCNGNEAVFKFSDANIDSIKFQGSAVFTPGSSQTFTGSLYTTYSYEVKFKNGCKNYLGTTRVDSACTPFVPSVDKTASCTTGKYVFTGLVTQGVTYKINGVVKTKAQLENLDLLEGNPIGTTVKLEYTINATGATGEIDLPSKSTCTSCNVPVVITQTTANTLRVTVTGADSYVVTVKGVSPVSSPVSYTFTLGSAVSGAYHDFTSLVNGSYSVEVANATKSHCPKVTKTASVNNCSSAITISEQDCDLRATSTGTCACKDITWQPKIVSITDQGTSTLVIWESQINYSDAQITAGKVKVEVDVVGSSIDTQGYTSGSITIPSTPVNSSVGTMSLTIQRFNYGFGPVLSIFPILPSPYSFDEITSVIVEDNDITGTFNTYPINGYYVDDTNHGPSYWNITVGFANLTSYSTSFEIDSTINSVSLTPELFKQTYNPQPTDVIRFTLEGLQLEDGCIYNDLTKDIFSSATTFENYTLTASNPLGRKIKYIWTEGNKIVKQQFSSTYSTFAGSLMTLTEQYEVKAECNCTSVQQTVSSCLMMPTFSNLTLNGAGTSLSYTISGGCYTTPIVLKIGVDSYGPFTKTYGTDLTGTITLTTPINQDTAITGEYQNKPECKFYGTINTNVYVVNITQEGCGLLGCAPTEYTIKVAVTKNGVLVPSNLWAINSISAGSVVSSDSPNFQFQRIGCIATAATTTFDVVIDSKTIAQTYSNDICSACVAVTYNVGLPTSICDTDTSSSISITGLPAGSFEYRLNGVGAYATVTNGQSIAITFGSFTQNIIIRSVGDTGTCGLVKSFSFNALDCTVPPPPPTVNCNIAGASPSVSLNGTITQGDCNLAVSNVFYPAVTVTQGVGPFTYLWSPNEGTSTIVTSTVANPTITVTGFTGRDWSVNVEVTGANGCKGYGQLWGKKTLSCGIGEVACGSDCSATCVPTGTCIGGSQCPNVICNGVCCQPGQVCADGCKNIGQPCGPCSTAQVSGCISSCTYNCQCCTGTQCRNRITSLILTSETVLGTSPNISVSGGVFLTVAGCTNVSPTHVLLQVNTSSLGDITLYSQNTPTFQGVQIGFSNTNVGTGRTGYTAIVTFSDGQLCSYTWNVI